MYLPLRLLPCSLCLVYDPIPLRSDLTPSLSIDLCPSWSLYFSGSLRLLALSAMPIPLSGGALHHAPILSALPLSLSQYLSLFLSLWVSLSFSGSCPSGPLYPCRSFLFSLVFSLSFWVTVAQSIFISPKCVLLNFNLRNIFCISFQTRAQSTLQVCPAGNGMELPGGELRWEAGKLEGGELPRPW